MSTRSSAGDARWYRDAVFYQLHVRSYADSNGDGVGDFPGLVSRLDHLQWLGVDCLWLLPMYPSPGRDDGYDIADYLSVHPGYGTLDDFRRFLDEAHARGLRVVTELVVNHTSDQHPWFQEARRSRDDPRRGWYVWSDTDDRYRDARIIFLDSERSNWAWDPGSKQYYWHRFFSHQPDLNYDNPAVREEMWNVMRFWLDLGVDGFRVDAVPYLIEREGTSCENLPETHDVLTLEMVTEVERAYMWDEFATDPRARLNLGIRRRLAPLLDGDRRRIELLNAILMSLPGSPIIYYGDEIGMGDNIYLGDRNGVRTPMPWTGGWNAGFSSADPERLWLPLVSNPVYGYQAVNVESQRRTPSSLLHWTRRLIQVRRSSPVFGRGAIELLRPANHRVLAYVRTLDRERVLVVNNLASTAQAVELDLATLAGEIPVEMFGGSVFPRIGTAPYFLTLGPYDFYWFRLRRL